MRDLTLRQKEVLTFVKNFMTKHKYSPSIREIAAFFSISTKGAYDHIKALTKKEKLKMDPNRSRAIELMEPLDGREEVVSVPILGNVAAGVPLFATENFDGYLKIPVNQIKQGNYFALKVKGDSMTDAGILDGDMAVFLQQADANNGSIVVAMVNEAVTMKRLYKEKNRIRLKAENPVYPPIYTQNAQILGKLVLVFRHYE
ncbi:MAG: transcriptional repressor LexA [Spirochaetales bacterium]|nr:MAG: transcriptional repressor LexA [Spirochaetales bacterium]